MKQEVTNLSKTTNEEVAKVGKRGLNQVSICGSEAIKKDIVVNSAAPLPMSLVSTAQLITLQLNNVSKPLEKLSGAPVFTSASRGHSIPVPILAKPAATTTVNVMPRRRMFNAATATGAQEQQVNATTAPQNHPSRLHHNGSQTEASNPEVDVLNDAIKKIVLALDDINAKLSQVQSKVISLEARFTAVYGDDNTFFAITASSKTGSGEKALLSASRRKRSFTHNRLRLWNARRQAYRLAIKSTASSFSASDATRQQKSSNEQPERQESVVPASSNDPLPPPIDTLPTTTTSTPSSSTPASRPPSNFVPIQPRGLVRRSRRITGSSGNEQSNSGTKAKIAKLLMDARLEMAAEEKERSLDIKTGLSTAPSTPGEDVRPLQMPSDGSTIVSLPCAAVNTPSELTVLPPILPLLSCPISISSATATTTITTTESSSIPLSLTPGPITTASSEPPPPPPPPTHSGPAAPTPPQLPPIPAKYRRPMLLDTSEIARQTKDMLLKCAISQRSFGQNVLGLSQGSVSDLLTRPKPWSMLTNKGREPFIRMKLFLENPRSLNGFEYNITMGKDGVLPLKQGKSDELRPLEPKPSSEPLGTTLTEVASSTPKIAIPALSTPASTANSATAGAGGGGVSSGSSSALDNLTLNSTVCGRSCLSIDSPEAQKLLKEGFDVLKTVADAKLLLNTTSMTQRTLGNTVLGLSQASVSDLLCKCRPWDQISGSKPRVSYVRLKLWVDSVRMATALPETVESTAEEPRAKRQRTDSDSSSSLSPLPTAASILLDAGQTEAVARLQDDAQRDLAQRPGTDEEGVEEGEGSKQLSEAQLDVLVNFFNQCPEPDSCDMSELAKQICCSLDEVSEWFERRRADETTTPLSPLPTQVPLSSIKLEDTHLYSTLFCSDGGVRKNGSTCSSNANNQEKDSSSSGASGGNCSTTGSHNRRKKTIPTRILPSASVSSLPPSVSSSSSSSSSSS